MNSRHGYVSGPKVFVVFAQLSLVWLVWYGFASMTETATSLRAWTDYRAGVDASKSGDYASAIERFDRVVQRVPRASNAYLAQACSHAGVGDTEAAALAFRDGHEVRLLDPTTTPCWDELLDSGLRLAFADFVPVAIVVPDEPSSLMSLSFHVISEGQEERDPVAVLAGSVCLHSEQGLDRLADAYFIRLAEIVSEDSVGHPDIIDCVDRFFDRAYPDA